VLRDSKRSFKRDHETGRIWSASAKGTHPVGLDEWLPLALCMWWGEYTIFLWELLSVLCWLAVCMKGHDLRGPRVDPIAEPPSISVKFWGPANLPCPHSFADFRMVGALQLPVANLMSCGERIVIFVGSR
jgi:hypothetical protein